MNHGLSPATVDAICGVLTRFPAVERALLYGSRAKGKFKPGSDIDVSLCGKQLTFAQLGEIEDALDDLLLPYGIDLSLYDQLGASSLRAEIERTGREFYRRNEASAAKRKSA